MIYSFTSFPYELMINEETSSSSPVLPRWTVVKNMLLFSKCARNDGVSPFKATDISTFFISNNFKTLL